MKKVEKVLSLRKTIRSLKYVAGSPREIWGGFSDTEILTARSALHHIRRLRRTHKGV